MDKNAQYVPQNSGVEITLDTNADGRSDCVLHTSAGGHTVCLDDTDFDGRIDTVTDYGASFNQTVSAYIDSDGDGTLDHLFQDSDGDAVWDEILADRDGDGVFETPVIGFND